MAVARVNPIVEHLVEDFFTFYDITPGPVLGCGMSGKVVLTTSPTDSSLKIAVKKLPLLTWDGSIISMHLFTTEIGLIQGLSHPNVIRHILSAHCPEYLVICTEYCPNGTLTSRLGNMSPELCTTYFLQMACAVRYLNDRQRIIHCDVKPDNIFINAHNEAVLGDFGLSLFISPNDNVITTYNMEGTLAFMAPEVRTCSHVDPFKVDVYSLGAVLWCMMFRMEPDHTHSEPFQMEVPLTLDVPLVLESCLLVTKNPDPAKRPTALELLRNLRSLDFYRDLIDRL